MKISLPRLRGPFLKRPYTVELLRYLVAGSGITLAAHLIYLAGLALGVIS